MPQHYKEGDVDAMGGLVGRVVVDPKEPQDWNTMLWVFGGLCLIYWYNNKKK